VFFGNVGFFWPMGGGARRAGAGKAYKTVQSLLGGKGRGSRQGKGARSLSKTVAVPIYTAGGVLSFLFAFRLIDNDQ